MNAEYQGKVSNIVAASADCKAFEKRLSEFEGMGPKTIEIFMREAAALILRSFTLSLTTTASQLRAARRNHGNAQTNSEGLAVERFDLR